MRKMLFKKIFEGGGMSEGVCLLNAGALFTNL